MQDTIIINDITYALKEEFDVNLALDYENDTWEEWHILREFISNALDSVAADIAKIKIDIRGSYIYIVDKGEGYPLVYAKRIGATSKRNEAGTIGQFGEGIKLSLLTCIRKNIKVSIASRNWLIIPKTVEMEGQNVLFYDIYLAEKSFNGTLVLIEATEKTLEVINNIERYFLHFKHQDCLFGSLQEGIYPLLNGISSLYNKGVFIRDIDALYSYAISIEKLNRDRDFISHSDAAYRIRDILRKVDRVDIVKSVITASTIQNDEHNTLIEFYSGLYSDYPDVWAKAFDELYGKNAVIFTNDIAGREAKALGYNVIRLGYHLSAILKRGGVKEDQSGLSNDYEFTFANDLYTNEKSVLQKLCYHTRLLNIEPPQIIKVFENYANHENIPGIYIPETEHLYLKRSILSGDFDKALSIFLHEVNHHCTQADDLSREFAQELCDTLTRLLIMYEKDTGYETELEVKQKGILIPSGINLFSESLYAGVVLVKN